MTVGELIAGLTAFDLDMEVVCVPETCGCLNTMSIETVEEGEYVSFSADLADTTGSGYHNVKAILLSAKEEP